MSNKVKLGKIGEELVAKYFGVPINEDFYDTEKDLLLPDGTKVEVKTQNRHPTKHLLTLRASNDRKGLNNLLKCFTVDRLIFVEYDHSDVITLWECVNRKEYEIYTTSPAGGLITMVGFPIKNMSVLDTITDAKLASEMRSLSSSAQFK